MNNKFINKKLILFSILFSRLGILIILFGSFILVWANQSQSYLRYIIVFLGLAFLFLGAFIMCEKCKCPHCSFGRSGNRFSDSAYHSLLTIKNVRKGMIICPKCKSSIEIK